MPLEYALESLQNKYLWLANPTRWEDPFEKRFVTAKYIDDAGKEKNFSWLGRVFCICFTQTPRSEAYWSVYSRKEIGIQLRINRSELLKELEVFSKDNENFKVYIGNATKVLDPTLLLTREDYLSLINNKQYPKDDKPILAKYILDETPEIEKSIQSIAKKNNYIIKDTNLAGWGNNHNIPTPQISVEDWLYTFSSAKLIINDSFHATVFSILFHKSFVVIINQQRGTSRIRSLLNMFGLEDRMVTSLNDISNFRDIDYKQIDLKLDKLRMNSLHFLQKYLKD